MIKRIGDPLVFDAHFLASGAGATGLTVVVNVWRDSTQVVTNGSGTEIGKGVYTYTLSSASVTIAGSYRCVFETTGTADQKCIAARYDVGNLINAQVQAYDATKSPAELVLATPANKLATDGTGRITVGAIIADAVNAASITTDAVTKLQNGLATSSSQTAMQGNVTTILGRCDVAISTRMATFTYTAPPTATDNATAVWNAGARTLTSAGSGGATAAEVWAYVDRTLTSAGTGGPTASDIAGAVWGAGTRTLTAEWVGPSAATIAGAVWSNAARALTTTIPTAAEIATSVLTTAIDGTLDLTKSIRLLNAAAFGSSSGFGTARPQFNSPDGSKVRIVGDADADGNRSNITYDAS